jgi:meso-butanediol dehydrogenase / (S,S)-butanediol dehydrogenase / diacetyl reductase
VTLPELAGRVAIVTGAGSGIGQATATRLGEAGARLVLVGRNRTRLLGLRRGLGVRGIEAVISSGDVGREATARRAIEASRHHFGRLDILVNNAGMALMKTAVETTLEEWERIMATNLSSVFLFSRAAIPLMTETGGGAIVNVASEAGLVGFKGYAAYSASKAAVVNLTRAMALDHAVVGIRVNCVCPGSIETPLLQAYYAAFADPVAARNADVQAHPLGLGDPDDIAWGIVYLVSDRAKYITGHALAIDGGFTAQ